MGQVSPIVIGVVYKQMIFSRSRMGRPYVHVCSYTIYTHILANEA